MGVQRQPILYATCILGFRWAASVAASSLPSDLWPDLDLKWNRCSSYTSGSSSCVCSLSPTTGTANQSALQVLSLILVIIRFASFFPRAKINQTKGEMEQISRHVDWFRQKSKLPWHHVPHPGSKKGCSCPTSGNTASLVTLSFL